MKRVCILYVDAGGGHRATAMALKEVLSQQSDHWHVTTTSFYREIIPQFDLALRVLKISGEDIYNKLVLKYGFTPICWPILTPLYHWHLKYGWKFIISTMHQFIEKHKPDMIISVAPFINQYVYKILQMYNKAIPFVTLLTDFEECHPLQWLDKLESQQGRYYIVGTKRLIEQAKAKSIQPEKIFLTSGMVISPRFYQREKIDVANIRQQIGLDAHVPTALIAFGGYASNNMFQIAKQLSQCDFPIQAIFICGHNNHLVFKLKNKDTPFKKYVVGYTSNIAYYMNLADFYIGKPGPGSVTEALVMKLPVIIKNNQFTLRQERPVAKWLVEHQFGTEIKSFSNLADTIKSFLSDNLINHYRANLDKLDNQAVFQISDILQNISNKHIL